MLRSSKLVLVLLAVPFFAQVLPACQSKLAERFSPATSQKKSASSEQGALVKPPFEVRGELEGLLLVWMDKEGLHSAEKRSEIPDTRRERVRVDSLQIAPDQRLDEQYIFLADVRQPQADGSYPVRKVRRDWFETLVDSVTPEPAKAAKVEADKKEFGSQPGAVGSGVTIYGASWCGACRAAASYLRARNIAFEEKDVEKNREAYAEMQRKAAAAGVRPGALPLIDFRGHVLSGFSPETINNLIERGNR